MSRPSLLDRTLARPTVVYNPPRPAAAAPEPCSTGPFDLPPEVQSGIEAGRQLELALRGILLGRADKALLVRTERWHWSDVVILASLLERARLAGAAGGAR